jgi:hypothetical protein
VNKISRAPDKTHSKYLHVYAIVRFDLHAKLENCATVVKVLPTRDLAEQEADRLRQVNEGKQCLYNVQITRFVGAPAKSKN